MKIRLFLATATAASVLMTAAALADDNVSDFNQDGDYNVLTVDQENSVSGIAGEPGDTGAELRQFGDNNTMTVTQSGRDNSVASGFPSVANRGAYQTGNYNLLSITQDSGNSSSTNGNTIRTVRQVSSTGAGSSTNEATIVQQRVDGGASTLQATNFINTIRQTHGGGAKNVLSVTQTGEHASWYSGGQGNLITSILQNGSDNSATIVQQGQGPLLNPSGPQQRGPANVLQELEQVGDGHEAIVTQDGFANFIGALSQTGGNDNFARIVLVGDGNGATAPGSIHSRPTVGLLSSGAGAAGAAASNVIQIGSNNVIDYEVTNGNGNQFGFDQEGNGNLADNILITGNDNELGVYQQGDDNKLLLATIDGDDNIVGVRQLGSDNTVDLEILGGSSNQNGGYWLFGAGPAGSEGLTPGLIEQIGEFNSVELTVSGSENVFATKQDNSSSTDAVLQNQIVGTITGAGNQVAVVQMGNNNTTHFTQNGGNNDALVTQ